MSRRIFREIGGTVPQLRHHHFSRRPSVVMFLLLSLQRSLMPTLYSVRRPKIVVSRTGFRGTPGFHETPGFRKGVSGIPRDKNG